MGNFFTVREVLKRYKPEIIRFFILSSHYRSPLNYSDEQLDEAATALTRLYTALRGVAHTTAATDSHFLARFKQAMDDDFNTPVALAVLFDVARELNTAKSAKDAQKTALLAATVRCLGQLLGILQQDPDAFLQGDSEDGDIQTQIDARIAAKKTKNWALADQIRDQLKSQGILLEDTPDGLTAWRRE